MMTKKVSFLRSLFNVLTEPVRALRDPRLNADGSMTTKHGNKIILYEINGNLRPNLIEFMSQPRIQELREQMKPIFNSPVGDIFMLNSKTGDFYLKSDMTKNGIEHATILGQIDVDLEDSLFDHAAREVVMAKMFRGVSPENPIMMDESGRVYAKNNPDDFRGQINIGPTVIPGSRPRKP